jgi:hypothetical protein
MTAMRTYDDHSLEFWGDVFQACRLASVDVRFEDFIANPQRILQDFGMEDAVEIMESGYLPLLPKQARIRAHLERPVTFSLSLGTRTACKEAQASTLIDKVKLAA